MIASRLTVQRLLNRLPAPRRATLADLGHVAAMLARAKHTPGEQDAQLTTRLTELRAWATDADRHHATDRKAAA